MSIKFILFFYYSFVLLIFRFLSTFLSHFLVSRIKSGLTVYQLFVSDNSEQKIIFDVNHNF